METELSPASLVRNELVAGKQELPCKVYKKRWVIITLFVLYCISTIMQWHQYSIIADVIVNYYGVSYTAVNWSSLIFMLVYILVSFPSSYLLDRISLRAAVLIGMTGTCVGAWIKVASVEPNRYWVVLLGQTVVATFVVLVLPLPPKIAAVWFGATEVSSACSIGVLGLQVGFAVGFLMPPMLVHNSAEAQDVNSIESGLFNMALSVAVFTSIIMIFLVLFFQSSPPTPPSLAQLQMQEKGNEPNSFTKSLKNLLLNPSYLLLLVAYGLNLGLYFAIATLLNQIVLKYHPDAATDAGIMGLVMILAGMVGSVISGVILDRYYRYRETMLVAYVLSLVSMVGLIFAVNGRIEFLYLVVGLMGFSMTGIVTIGFELGVELTYPEPESTSGGILTTSTEIFGIIFTYLYTFLFNGVGDVWANVTMSAILVVGSILVLCIKYDLRRHTAQAKKDSAS